jgi:hypothetical protein
VAERLKRLFFTSFDWAWALMFLLLPITTLPALVHLFGWVTVAPASSLPLIWLVVWFILFLFRKGELPHESIPFLAFVSVAVISSAVAFFMEYPTFKARDLLGTESTSLLTLGIGAAFYLVSIAWLSSRPQQFEKTLRLLNYAGMIMLAWSSLQAVYALFFNSHYPDIMYQIQSLFNTRGLFRGRVTGFSFEPSWLAHQINLFFLPFWLAATIKRTSVHRLRLWKITVENVLLMVGMVMIFLSSRIGTLAVLLVLIFLGIRLHLWGLGKIYAKFNERMKFRSPFQHFAVRVVFFTALLSLLIFIYLLALFGLVFTLANIDPRIARLFDLEALKLNLSSPYELFNQLMFAERYVYWVTGWHIFNDYPLLGVGLGNAGLYFLTHLPSYGWVLVEVIESVYRLPAVMNIKSFWVRILAETGLAGFATFASWYAILWQTSRFLEANKQKLMSMLGLAGQLVLVAFIAEGFSIDTFALPYLWLALGFISAAGMLARRQMTATPDAGQPGA